jgi:hypothetical protein
MYGKQNIKFQFITSAFRGDKWRTQFVDNTPEFRWTKYVSSAQIMCSIRVIPVNGKSQDNQYFPDVQTE